MLNRSELATASRRLATEHTRLGLPVPTELAEALAAAADLDQRADGLRPTREEAAAAVRAATAAGRDPATDKACQKIATRQALAALGAGTGMANAADDLRLTAVREHFDDLMAAWRSRFDPAAAAIARAHVECPQTPLTGDADVSRLRPAQLTAWHDGRQGLTTVANIASLWITVARAARLASVGSPWTRALIVAELDADTAEQVGPKAGPTELAAAGLPLALASPQQHAERVEALHQSQAARDLAAEQARQDTRSAPWKHGPGRRAAVPA